jgi:hypothetical protein
MKGDTLIFYGFKKIQLANGKIVASQPGYDRFIEKRVRAKQ